MDDVDVIYSVRSWIRPESKVAILRFLADGHIADVVSQPGFRWARQLDMGRVAADGWEEFIVLYGVASQACMADYFASAAVERYAEEMAPFREDVRVERSFGTVICSVDAQA